MRITFTLLFLLFTLTLSAQKIQILSQEDNAPISGAVLFNKDKSKSGITDFDGFVDITKFDENESITIKHISHFQQILTKKEIIASGGIITLEINASSLDEIVLSVSKFGQNKREIPQQIISVKSEDVLFKNPQTAADLLESSGQVYVQKSQLGGGSPLIRGFSTNRLLITVDGVRFNTAIFRGGNVQNVIS